MPLKKGNSKETIQANIDELIRAGHSPEQAAAIAYKEAGEANDSLAMDKSVRELDADGRMHVLRTNISKANVCDYYGQEIPNWQGLGLEPDKIYKMYRAPSELEKGAETFARLPVLSEHVPVTVDSPRPDLVVGAIGSDVEFDGTYLTADISVWDKNAIAGIETDTVRELSCAYRYVPVMTAGVTPDGVEYDGVMTEIKGNHLALVEVGRAGSDVVVADSKPNFNKELAMPKTRKEVARDKLLAHDSAMNAEQADKIIDAVLGVEDNPEPQQTNAATVEQDQMIDTTPTPAADESPADKLRAILAGKVDEETLNAALGCIAAPAADEESYEPKLPTAQDEDQEDDTDKKVEAAMDSLRAEFKQLAQAERDVRPIVGDVIGVDSAADVYGFALKHMGVDSHGLTDTKALQVLFKVASAQKPTMDAALAAKVAVAGLDRFTQI